MAFCGAWAKKKGDLRLESAAAKIIGSEWYWEAVNDLFQVRGGRGFMTAEAAKEEQRLQSLVRGSKALANRAERRMLWGTALETLANAVPREVQISSLSGGLAPGRDTVEILLDGVAAGSEPRTVAEDFRLALRTKFGRREPWFAEPASHAPSLARS